MNTYRLISCCLSFLSFVFFLLAHCSNNWRAYRPVVGYYTIGLWTICSDISGCRKLSGAHVRMEITRVLMLVALVGSFLAFVWATKWDHLFHCNFTFLPKSLMACICNFVAGTSLTIGLMMFEMETTPVPENMTSTKDWGFYVSCVAGILCFFVAILDFLAYKYSLWGPKGFHCPVDPEYDEDSMIPTVAPGLL